MARYTIQVYSGELSATFGRHKGWVNPSYGGSGDFDDKEEGKFSFSLPNLVGTEIKSISVTAPVTETRGSGGYGCFALKLGSSTLNSWVDSTTTVWDASNLAITGKQSDTLTLELKPANGVYNRHSWEGGEWSWTGRILGRATATIVIEGEFAETTVSPISGENIPKSLPNTFSWNPTIVQGSIVSQNLYWKQLEETDYKRISVGIDDTTYTFPPNTFRNGNINWYIEGTDSSGNVAKSAVETVIVGIAPSVVIAYPNNVNIRNTNKQIFTWEMSESVATGQKAYELQYKARSASQWTTIRRTSSNQYHEFDASTFSTDTYDWKLKVTNNDDISTEYVSASFVAIGATGAPNITNITNSSIPTIRWEISSQDTFEIELYSGSERIYVSGVQVGANVREFTPNIMLEDGNYIVKMRSMNEYGYFTEWSDYAFVLAPQKPEAVECMVYANECHGINVMMISGNADLLYVLRRRFGELNWDILGKLKSGEVFVDNTTMTGVKYEYTLRNYKKAAGYTDSNVVSMIIEHQGSIVYDGSDFVLLYKTEDAEFQISHTPAKSYSDSYMIGRKYPVRESSEWMAHTTNLSCFVLFEEYEKLERFYESNDSLWFKGDNFSFKCSIDSIQIRETLLGKGYTISIDLSRMDENEVNLLE